MTLCGQQQLTVNDDTMGSRTVSETLIRVDVTGTSETLTLLMTEYDDLLSFRYITL